MEKTVAACAVCEANTFHVEGKCEPCSIRKKAAQTPPPIPTAAKAPATPQPEPKRFKVPVLTVGLLAVLVGVIGLCHFVYGSSGWHLCAKDGWSLSDTFIDIDDYVGHSRFELMDKARVMRALAKCSLVSWDKP